jgi:hypothetical protein
MRKRLKSINHGNNVIENHYDDGRIEWLKDGLVDRDDGPAIETADGWKKWFKKGYLHREDGPAVIQPDGSNCWMLNGKEHRVGGSSSEYLGNKKWCLNGKLHREDGPAVENKDGTTQWWIDGRKLSQQEIDAIILNKELQKELESNSQVEKKPKI